MTATPTPMPRRRRRAVAALELALALPFLLILLLGGTDIVRFVATANKIDRTAATLADLLARADRLEDRPDCAASNCLGSLYLAADEVATPLDLQASGRVILTAVVDPGSGPAEIAWQRTRGELPEADSRIGIPGAPATLPEGFSLPADDTAVIAEVYYEFAPFPLSGDLLFSGLLTERIYRIAYFRPRFGDLSSLD
mgnify:CR=1 FL=1